MLVIKAGCRYRALQHKPLGFCVPAVELMVLGCSFHWQSVVVSSKYKIRIVFMNNSTALDKPEQLLQLVFGLLWTANGVGYLFLFLSHKLCGHREHRSLCSVEGIESIMSSQSIQRINCFVMYQGGKFLSYQERALEFGWGMQDRQRQQSLWDVWGSITKVVTCKAPVCVSHNLQWKQPLKAVWFCFFFLSTLGTADNGEGTVCQRLAQPFPVPAWMPTCLLCPCQPARDKVISVTFSCSLLVVQGLLLLLNQKLNSEIKLKDVKEADDYQETF